MKNILIACEESQRVCTAFRQRGHNAYSCDLVDCSGGHPEWHIKDDVLKIINGGCLFSTMDGVLHHIFMWDLIIAHPPCTYLTNSGAKWYDVKKYGDKAIERILKRDLAVKFFMSFVNVDCTHIAIENPIGYMNTFYRKPDCIYNPFDFIGETECKKTCLWLKNLPVLVSNRPVPLAIENRTHNGFKGYFNGVHYRWNDPECSKMRSKTPVGVAQAMADQWGYLL